MAATFGYTSKPKTIEVPLQHEQVLEVVCNDLPVNPLELTDIFRQEGVALAYYRALAIEYYEQHKINESVSVIQTGLTLASQTPHTQPRQKLPLLTLLATLHMRFAKHSMDANERQDHLNSAAQAISEAERIHNQYEQCFIVKGNLFLMRQDIKEAIRCFDMVLEKRPSCIPALLSKAKILYHNKDYKGALTLYQKALLFSQGDAAASETRLGIAQCFSQLGMFDEAKVALQACIDKKDATTAAALILLSIIEQNESKAAIGGPTQQQASLKSGLQHMQQSHYADKQNPVTLNMLSNYFFFTDDMEKAIRTSTKALSNGTNNSTKAESCYQLARTHHKMNRYNEALNYYRQCLQLNPEHILAQFGIGQMHLQKEEYTVALGIFENILEAEPQCIEAMKILGSIYTLTDKKQQALALFNKGLEKSAQDVYLLMEIARLNEEKNPTRALDYYSQTLDIVERENNEHSSTDSNRIRPELLNNIGAMYHKQGDLDKAEQYYSRAIQACDDLTKTDTQNDEDNENNIHVHANNAKLTITYNLGRLYEDRSDTEKATVIYNKIVEDYPSYADAHFRLGVMQQLKGDINEAIEHYKQVFGSDENDAKAWIMIGQAQSENNDKTCKRSFEKVLKSCDKDDLYTHVALGNYHASAAREMKTDKQSSQRQDSYKLAVNFYTQALKRDPKNAYAANGLAIVLAENNNIDQAKDIFAQVREATPNNPCVWINLAHIFVDLKHLSQAIVMYENALKKFYRDGDANILLCLARAQFMLAKNTKDPEIMYESLLNTKRAQELQPEDKSTMYNIALVQQQYAQLISDLPTVTRTSDAMRKAIEGLENSQQLFRTLINVPEDEHVYYDRKMAEQRERFGETLRTQMDRKMLEQLQYEEQRETKLKEVRLRQEQREAKRRQDELDKIQAEEDERQRLEEDRRRLMEKVREDNMMMAQRELELQDDEQVKKSRSSSKKRKHDNDRDGIVSDGDEDDEEEDDEAPTLSKKKYRSKAIIQDSDEESD
ncbi:hypothetical protein BC941DRAFT_510409 [Chlamydoabsidia padenii]|nr:hypothetical protein BC941DRAFT_510409 [Chlamydoabsidia padenii]